MADDAKQAGDAPSGPRWGSVIFAALLIVGGGAGWLYLDLMQLKRLAPPEGVTTFAEFAKSMPPPRHLAVVEENGQPTIIWIGERAAFPAVPSGPACYRFDGQGQLLDWSAQTGEGGQLDQVAAKAQRSPSLPLEEVAGRLQPAE